jgi:hypothetical protein
VRADPEPFRPDLDDDDPLPFALDGGGRHDERPLDEVRRPGDRAVHAQAARRGAAGGEGQGLEAEGGAEGARHGGRADPLARAQRAGARVLAGEDEVLERDAVRPRDEARGHAALREGRDGLGHRAEVVREPVGGGEGAQRVVRRRGRLVDRGRALGDLREQRGGDLGELRHARARPRRRARARG